MYLQNIFIDKVNNYMIASQEHKIAEQEEQQSNNYHRKGYSELCYFIAWLKLNQTRKNGSPRREKQANSPGKRQEASGVITTSETDKNTVHFHSFKKFNSFQFQFQKIFLSHQTNFSIAKNINLYDQLVINNKDFCLLVIGGVQSGIQTLCQNQNKEGLFSLMLCSLFDQIESISEQKVQKVSESQFISNLKMSLKFIVVSNEKLYDLTTPKNVVVLKDNKNKHVLSGCQTFEPSSVYDITLKMQQMSKNRRLIYPQSIMLVEGELSFDKPSIFGQITSVTRRFSLIQWQKSLGKGENNPKNANNNLSLLNLNMCLYELYKDSCKNTQDNQKKSRKIWSIFRNSTITRILKSYILNSKKLIVLGCVDQDENEEEVYQTLTICKNAAKIKWNTREQEGGNKSLVLRDEKKKVEIDNVPGYITEPLSTQKIEKRVDRVDLSRVKQQLKKILREKEMSEEKQKEKQVWQLLKLENKKKIHLRNIRYHKQQLRFKEQIKQVRHNRSQSTQPANLPAISSFNAEYPRQHSNVQKRSEKNLSQQQNLKKEVSQLREKLIKNIRESNNLNLNHSFLKQQIHRQQSEVIEYVAHKQKMINYLKSQVRELKKEYKKQNKHELFVNPVANNKQSFKTIEPKTSQPQKTKNEVEQQEQAKSRQELEGYRSRKQRVMTQHIGQPKQNLLKMSNRKSYVFQKRRMELKQKIRKDKQKRDNQYEQAAKRFQEYSRVKK